MKFKDLNINDKFVKDGEQGQYVKVPEERVSCCNIRCNAKAVKDDQCVVFRPLDEVTKL